MIKKFPFDVKESLGQFQVVDTEGAPASPVRTGALRLHGERAHLEVSPEMTPSVEWTQTEQGTWIGQPSNDEPIDFTVLGTLAIAPGEVSLWQTTTLRRRTLGMAPPRRRCSWQSRNARGLVHHRRADLGPQDTVF